MRFAFLMFVLVAVSIVYTVDVLTDSPADANNWLTEAHQEQLAEAVTGYSGWTAACVALDRARFPVTVPKGKSSQRRRLLADGVTMEVRNVADAPGGGSYTEKWKDGAFCYVPE